MPYFDYNATTPLAPVARAAWLHAQDDAWQNPASAHRAGARVRALLDRERSRLAGSLSVAEERIVFTSGATEGANTVFAALAARAANAARVLLNPTEHSCVLAAARRWFPGRCDMLPLLRSGVVDTDRLPALFGRPGVALVAVMAANNETGVLQPWREIAELCRNARIPYLCDAAQWLGKLPADGLGEADFVIAAGHKFGGPKNTGFLLVPGGALGRETRLLVGGGQQAGHRAGTEDYPGVAAMVAALEESDGLKATAVALRRGWKERFEHELVRALPQTRIIGMDTERLWNTTMAILPAAENQRWLTKLDRRGFQVSTSAACTAAQGLPSPVLAAMGIGAADARRALRFSSGLETTEADWNALLDALTAVAGELAGAEMST